MEDIENERGERRFDYDLWRRKVEQNKLEREAKQRLTAQSVFTISVEWVSSSNVVLFSRSDSIIDQVRHSHDAELHKQ